MRIASKSAIGFPSSNGFERYKLSSYSAGFAVANCRVPRPLRGRWRLPISIDLPGVASCGSSGGNTPILRSVGGDRSCDHWLAFARLDQLHIKAKRLQLANQNVERLGNTRLDGRFAFDDGLVNLGAAIHVIGLRGQQFLQDVRRSVRFQGPDFHFSEALATELRLAAQRLLGDQRVRPDGTRVDLVVNQVGKFEHVDITDRDRLLELVTRHAVVEIRLAGSRQFAFRQQRLDLELLGSVEHWRSELDSSPNLI